MNDPLAAVEDAVRALRAAWAGEEGMPLADVTDLGGGRLIAVNHAIGTLRRQLDAVHAPIAAAIARESRRELGPDSLSKQQGFRSPAILIAAATGTSTGD